MLNDSTSSIDTVPSSSFVVDFNLDVFVSDDEGEEQLGETASECGDDIGILISSPAHNGINSSTVRRRQTELSVPDSVPSNLNIFLHLPNPVLANDLLSSEEEAESESNLQEDGSELRRAFAGRTTVESPNLMTRFNLVVLVVALFAVFYHLVQERLQLKEQVRDLQAIEQIYMQKLQTSVATLSKEQEKRARQLEVLEQTTKQLYELEETSRQQEERTRQLEDVSRQLGEKTEQMKAVSRQLGEKTRQLGEKTRQLGEKKRELGRKMRQLKDISRQLEEKSRQVDELAETTSQLEEKTWQLEGISRQLKTKTRQLDDLEGRKTMQLKEISRQLKEKTMQLEDIARQLGEKTRQLDEMQEKKRQTEFQVRRLKKRATAGREDKEPKPDQQSKEGFSFSWEEDDTTLIDNCWIHAHARMGECSRDASKKAQKNYREMKKWFKKWYGARSVRN
jgi:DNA repair exonuclease SbcCD ATPase subunit